MWDKIFISSPWVSQEKEKHRALGRIADTVTDKHNNQMQEINLILSRIKSKKSVTEYFITKSYLTIKSKGIRKFFDKSKKEKNNPALENLTDSKVNPAVYKNN